MSLAASNKSDSNVRYGLSPVLTGEGGSTWFAFFDLVSLVHLQNGI